jgi:D-alanyl-D-alanine carboxypeptidase
MTNTVFKWASALVMLAVIARADPADDHIRKQMEDNHVPGLAFAVLRDGKVIKSQGYGFASVERKAPVTEYTVFEIGSITKQFTAMLVMMLVEDGKINLDTAPSKYIEGLPVAWNTITIRRLLNHTSGLKNYTGLSGFEARRNLTATRFVNTLSAYPLDFQPGDSWSYSNSGYNLLGFILEKQSRMSYWELLQMRILAPLNMNATRGRDMDLDPLNRAFGYTWKTNKLMFRGNDLTEIFSAGAMASSVVDLAKWCQALDSDKFLTSTNRQLLWTPATLNSGRRYPYGFGWYISSYKGHRCMMHGGSTAGFSSTLQRFPDDKLDFIILCNLGTEGLAGKIMRGLPELYFQTKLPAKK